MATVPRPDYEALVIYLAPFGIDPGRIPEDSVDASGYDYWPLFEVFLKGNAAVKTEHKRWPSASVYRNVVRLMNGEAAQ